MTKAEKLAKKLDAATYYESSIGEHDVEILDNFMLENKVSPDELAFLSQMEAGWNDTTLQAIKADFDRFKVPCLLWFSKDEEEERLVFIVKTVWIKVD
jgi:hypothetical protein